MFILFISFPVYPLVMFVYLGLTSGAVRSEFIIVDNERDGEIRKERGKVQGREFNIAEDEMEGERGMREG